MLLVKTFIGPSRIHGVGLFAAEPIAAGRRIWEFNPAIDREISVAELDMLPPIAKQFVLAHAFVDEVGRMILSADNAIYFNHSEDANNTAVAGANVAARAIMDCEELTEDYRQFGRGACNEFLFTGAAP